MSTIPTKATEKQFEVYIEPHLSKAQRGFVCSIPLYQVFNYTLYRLHTGCLWQKLPITWSLDKPGTAELSWQAVYYHDSKWSKDGSLEKVFAHSILAIEEQFGFI